MFPAPEHQDTRTVEFTKGPNDSLGISIAGGVGSPLGDIPIFIAMMNPVGVAAQTQKLKVRDPHLPLQTSSACVGCASHLFTGMSLPPTLRSLSFRNAPRGQEPAAFSSDLRSERTIVAVCDTGWRRTIC